MKKSPDQQPSVCSSRRRRDRQEHNHHHQQQQQQQQHKHSTSTFVWWALFAALGGVLVGKRQHHRGHRNGRLHRDCGGEGGGSSISIDKNDAHYNITSTSDEDDPPLKVKKEGVLLPLPLDLVRRGIPLRAVYKQFPERRFGGSCSCLNHHAEPSCCSRRLRRTHKMGCLLSQNLFRAYEPQIRVTSDPSNYNYATRQLPPIDYRDAYIVRDAYESLVSGYLYHMSGRECWSNPWGEPISEYSPSSPPLLAGEDGGEDDEDVMEADGGGSNGGAATAAATTTTTTLPQVRDWPRGTSYELDPPSDGRSLCRYLAEEPEEVGLRAYVDWVVRYHYGGFLSHWALAREFPEVGERSKFVCYRDLAAASNRTLVRSTVEGVLQFLYNGTLYSKPWDGTLPSSDAGGHQTPRDPSLRMRLIEKIQKLDEKHYNNEIQWLHSVLPCQNDNHRFAEK